MSKRFWLFAPVFVLMFSATGFAQVELANLREDIRGLTQRLGELSLRLEQLERENGELHAKSRSADKNYVTLVQLNEAVADLNRVVKSAVATSKTETLQHVATQMEKLAKQTNSALDALAKNQANRVGVFYPLRSVRKGLRNTLLKKSMVNCFAFIPSQHPHPDL